MIAEEALDLDELVEALQRLPRKLLEVAELAKHVKLALQLLLVYLACRHLFLTMGYAQIKLNVFFN